MVGIYIPSKPYFLRHPDRFSYLNTQWVTCPHFRNSNFAKCNDTYQHDKLQQIVIVTIFCDIDKVHTMLSSKHDDPLGPCTEYDCLPHKSCARNKHLVLIFH